MPSLPARFAALILSFAPLFRYRSWRHAETLLIGAILAPGTRTVTSLLRIMGLSQERRFVNYHRVLNRAPWSARGAACLLLRLLLAAFVPDGPVLLGVDDTIERRRGKRIAAKGIYRDPVRSSRTHFVKASGLRWISLMLLAPIPWAGRIWALPFLTVLAPSERYATERGRRHKTLTDWARQMVLQVRHWLPNRALVLVADSSFAALELLAALLGQGVIGVTRLRLDAALYEPARPRRRGAPGRPASKGRRLPKLADVLTARTTRWQRVRVPGWYGEGDRLIEFCSATAVWYHAGLPIVPIRWVLLRDPLGLLSLSKGRSASAAVHRSRARAVADPRLVCPALAGRGHLPGGSRPSRGRDPAPVVGAGDRPYHAVPARTVFPGDTACHPPRPWSLPCGRDRRLVLQVTPHFRRHACRRPATVLAGTGFLHVPSHSGGAKTPAGAPRSHCPRALLCGIAPSGMAKAELRARKKISALSRTRSRQ
jgi:DDE superfamily endonuclease